MSSERHNVLLVVAVPLMLTGLAQAQEWQLLKGKHFIVYYAVEADFARRVLQKAEDCYDRVAEDLGYTRYGNFWLWADRARVYLYGTRGDFMRATRAPGWAVGKSDYGKREIAGFGQSEEFLDSLLPHELTHLIFREFVGFRGDVPLWLDEGVAQWQQIDRREEAHKMAGELALRNELIAVSDLVNMDVRHNADRAVVARFYAEAVSLVAYLIQEHGAERFTKLCRQLRDGKSLNDGLRLTYGDSIRDTCELQDRWREYLMGEDR